MMNRITGAVVTRKMKHVNTSTVSKQWVVVVLLIAFGGSFSACSDTSHINWNEEVQLSDGRIIVVERELSLLGGASRSFLPEMSTGKIHEGRIRFTSSVGINKTIEWRSTKRDYLTYPEIPLVFELDSSDRPIIFTIVGPVTAASSPCARYTKYIYQNGIWTEDPLPEQFRPLTTNLWLARFPEKRYVPELLTLAKKRKLSPTDEYAPAFRQVGPMPEACGKAYIR